MTLITREQATPEPQNNGLNIGVPIQAYLDKHTLKAKSFLCQLYGYPSQLIYIDLDHDSVHINSTSVILNTLKKTTFIDFLDLKGIAKESHTIPLKSLPLWSSKQGFIGFLDDFNFSYDINLDQVLILSQPWKLEKPPSLLESNSGPFLSVQEVSHGYETHDYPFFKKRVILKDEG